jgi:hypothetical protein
MKKLLLLAAILSLSSVSAFADALMLTVNATPYDRQMTPVRNILLIKASSNDSTSLPMVNAWMSDLREIPYGFSKEWKTPSEVETRRPADCKGKAVALYMKMKEHGATNVRLVIGKRAPTSVKTHAWLEWHTGNGDYVLDPTFNYTATRFEKIGKRSYVPLYAYAGSAKYRAAAAANLVAQN